jgi:hypothetical protein
LQVRSVKYSQQLRSIRVEAGVISGAFNKTQVKRPHPAPLAGCGPSLRRVNHHSLRTSMVWVNVQTGTRLKSATIARAQCAGPRSVATRPVHFAQARALPAVHADCASANEPGLPALVASTRQADLWALPVHQCRGRHHSGILGSARCTKRPEIPGFAQLPAIPFEQIAALVKSLWIRR